MRTGPRPHALLCGLAVALAFAGTAPAAQGPRTARVVLTDSSIAPQEARIGIGDSVTWANPGTHSYRIASDTGAWPAFGVTPRGEHTVPFPKAGRFPYTVDGARHAVVVVAPQEAGREKREKLQEPTGRLAWKGSFEVSVHQPLSTGTQDFHSNSNLTLTGDGKGGLTGEMSGTESQTLELKKCQSTTITPGTVRAKLGGTLIGGRITLFVMDRQSTKPTFTPCSGGQPGFMGPVFAYPHFDEPCQELTPTGDGTHQYDHEFSIPLGPFHDVYTLRYTLKVSQTGK